MKKLILLRWIDFDNHHTKYYDQKTLYYLEYIISKELFFYSFEINKYVSHALRSKNSYSYPYRCLFYYYLNIFWIKIPISHHFTWNFGFCITRDIWIVAFYKVIIYRTSLRANLLQGFWLQAAWITGGLN